MAILSLLILTALYALCLNKQPGCYHCYYILSYDINFLPAFRFRGIWGEVVKLSSKLMYLWVLIYLLKVCFFCWYYRYTMDLLVCLVSHKFRKFCNFQLLVKVWEVAYILCFSQKLILTQNLRILWDFRKWREGLSYLIFLLL